MTPTERARLITTGPMCVEIAQAIEAAVGEAVQKALKTNHEIAMEVQKISVAEEREACACKLLQLKLKGGSKEHNDLLERGVAAIRARGKA